MIDALIFPACRNKSPSAPVLQYRSDPARSTMDNLKIFKENPTHHKKISFSQPTKWCITKCYVPANPGDMWLTNINDFEQLNVKNTVTEIEKMNNLGNRVSR